MKELVIQQEDWEDCVAKWVNIALHPKIAEIDGICGLCEAMKRSGLENVKEYSCRPCPAYPKMCSGRWRSHSLFNEMEDNEDNWRIVKKGALEILEWLQELGELVGWTT